MTSPIDLCNQALGQIGAASQLINGINPANPPQSLAAQTLSITNSAPEILIGLFR